MVESASDEILAGADTSDVAFLVVGDPFGYDGHSIIRRKHSARLIDHYAVPPPTPTLSSELENSGSQ